MKCDNCIHKEVCKDKPPESYPQFMVNIMTDKCENYIHNAYVQPVKHGHWKAHGSLPTNQWSCSECRGLVEVSHYCNECYYDFCPNCGARMDGDDTYDKPT